MVSFGCLVIFNNKEFDLIFLYRCYELPCASLYVDFLFLLPMTRKSVENFDLGRFTVGSTESRLDFRRSRYQG